jgi:hypothetical protein
LNELDNFVTSKFSPKKKDIVVAGINISKYEETIIVAINISKKYPDKIIAIDYILGKTYIETIYKIIDFIKLHNISAIMIDFIPHDIFEPLLIEEIYNREIKCAVNSFVCNRNSKTRLIENLINRFTTNRLKIYKYAQGPISHLLEDLYNYGHPYKEARTLFALALAQEQIEDMRRYRYIEKSQENLWNRIISWVKNIFHKYRV